jgi:hypothetical protein
MIKRFVAHVMHSTLCLRLNAALLIDVAALCFGQKKTASVQNTRVSATRELAPGCSHRLAAIDQFYTSLVIAIV